jgi:hypothetical protein
LLIVACLSFNDVAISNATVIMWSFVGLELYRPAALVPVVLWIRLIAVFFSRSVSSRGASPNISTAFIVAGSISPLIPNPAFPAVVAAL